MGQRRSATGERSRGRADANLPCRIGVGLRLPALLLPLTLGWAHMPAQTAGLAGTHNGTAAPAERRLRQQLQANPDDVAAATHLADLLDSGQRGPEAEALLSSLARRDTATSQMRVLLGEVMLRHKSYPAALDAFESAMESRPDLPEAQAGFRRAAIAFALAESHQGEGEQALSILQRACETRPADVELQRSYGIEAMALGQTQLAVTTLEKALALAPQDPDSVLALARAQMNAQQVALAEPLFRQYLGMRPNDAGAHYGLGRLLTMQQNPEAAQAEFQRSIALQPRQDASYYELGQLSLDAQDDVGASAWFGRSLAVNPNQAGALTGMGIVAYRAHDYSRAETVLRQAIAAAPNYDVPHHYLGLALAKLHRDEDARTELQRAVALQPPGPAR